MQLARNYTRVNDLPPDASLRMALAAIAPAHVAYNSGENEWYTPPEYAEAARKVMVVVHLFYYFRLRLWERPDYMRLW